MAYRDGGQLDAEDSAAQDAVGIRRGQILQTHDEIQRAIAEMQQKEAAVPPPLPGLSPAGDEGAIAEAMKEVEAASWMRAGGQRGEPVTAAGKRRPGGYPILPGPGEPAETGGAVEAGVDAIGAARAAAGRGMGGAAVAGAAGAGALLLAQQMLSAKDEGVVGVPASGSEGGAQPMAVSGREEADMQELLEVQKKVAQVGLPIFGGPPTTPGGSKL